jgi:hypothetical protein
LMAAVARACAEHFSQHYFEALTVASSLWLAGALLWGTFLFSLVSRAAAAEATPAIGASS